MQLGEIFRNLSDETKVDEALLSCHNLALLASIAAAADRHDETISEYAACAVRRFANLAASEDWLGLMNAMERANDPGINCLIYMMKWSLKQDEASNAAPRAGCSCGVAEVAGER